MGSVDPTPDMLADFAALPSGGSITMLNLLRFRDRADYTAHPDETPCDGRQAYRRYLDGVMPLVEAIGGSIVFAGAYVGRVIAPPDEHWDDLLVVTYPERAQFIGVLTSEEYRSVSFHRSAALMDSRLIGFDGAPSFMAAST
ncbi:MAG: DUF1330 domain-containing protein [Sporichthyaceae bacterium]